jgi:uncharacterized membrane protein YgdD (TMEM256/DUF423 family)
MNNLLFRLGAISAASSVAIQALGGHKPWDVDRKFIFSKAFELHITSALGMMLCSFRRSKASNLAGLLLLAGSILFSGFAYYRCFNNDRKYNFLMPSGGGSIIIGWTILALS